MKILIMSGGKGERFWPKSNAEKPKQFLHIVDKDRTMIQLTVDRAKKICKPEDIFVITGERYEKITRDQLPEIPKSNILIEPEGRDTAACIGFSMLKIMERDDSEKPVVILAADHDINPPGKFAKTIKYGARLAREKDLIVTIGVKPTRPETGYGYLKVGKKLNNINAHYVDRFLEKPNLSLAIQYFESGKYLWNAGIFIVKPQIMLEEIKEYMPDLYKSLIEIQENKKDRKLVNKIYSKIEKISIDFGVMERTHKIVTVDAEFDWDDVGNWLALERISDKDDLDNILVGDILTFDSKRNIVYNDLSDETLVTFGIKNLVIINSNKKIFIFPKDRIHEVKKIIKRVKKHKK